MSFHKMFSIGLILSLGLAVASPSPSFAIWEDHVEALSASGSETGNGGSHVHSTFINKGWKIVSFLDSTEEGKKILKQFEINLDDLAAVLDPLKVKPADGPLYDVHGDPVDATADGNGIRLDKVVWQSHFDEERPIYDLILKEMARATVKLNSKAFEISQALEPYNSVIDSRAANTQSESLNGVYRDSRGNSIRIVNQRVTVISGLQIRYGRGPRLTPEFPRRLRANELGFYTSDGELGQCKMSKRHVPAGISIDFYQVSYQNRKVVHAELTLEVPRTSPCAPEEFKKFTYYLIGAKQPSPVHEGNWFAAARSNDVNTVSQMIADGQSVNETAPVTGDSAAIIAARERAQDVLVRLVRHPYIDLYRRNNKFETALLAAFEAGNQRGVDTILSAAEDQGLDINLNQIAYASGWWSSLDNFSCPKSPLHYEVEKNEVSSNLTRLLDLGLSPNRSREQAAMERGEVIYCLAPIARAVSASVVELLVSKGAHLDHFYQFSERWYPANGSISYVNEVSLLTYVIKIAMPEPAVRAIVEAQVAAEIDLNHLDSKGVTALTYAKLEYGEESELVTYMIANGAIESEEEQEEK